MIPVLTVNNFSLSLRQDKVWKQILKNLSFTLNKGETLGIVGESGSGKSVTALSIMGLILRENVKTLSGNIFWKDDANEQTLDLLTLTEKQRQKIRGKKIAMIFQEPMTSLNPVLRCGEQIVEAIRLHRQVSKKEAYRQVIDLLKEVKLPRPEQLFLAYPHELSGGQKQRIMIAMAICCRPDILIADEPTTALDVTVQKGILELLKNLQRKYNMSIIFITHDLGVVAEIANRMIVLFKGEIVEEGKVQSIFKNPQHPYTQGLLACRPPLNERLSHLPTIEDFLQNNREQNLDKETFIAQWKLSQEDRFYYHQQLYAEKPLLELKNLSKIYAVRKKKLFEKQKYVYALQDVSLAVYEGETLGLVGESGCGKTTLGRSMIRLIEPSSGKIFYKGKSLTKLSSSEMRKQRKDLQIILQDPYSSLNQHLTIGNALLEPMKVHGLYHNDRERKSRAIALLERVGLNESHFYRYPHEFSGGQRQRISIARALTLNPRFIICDESVSALDVSVQAQVLNLLNELKKEYRLTYIFISHDLSVVKFMSDRMAVMQNGYIVELDDADVIYTHPRTDYTKTLIAAIPQPS
jgi:peptide/nickel transport system ATP-binding protein